MLTGVALGEGATLCVMLLVIFGPRERVTLGVPAGVLDRVLTAVPVTDGNVLRVALEEGATLCVLLRVKLEPIERVALGVSAGVDEPDRLALADDVTEDDTDAVELRLAVDVIEPVRLALADVARNNAMLRPRRTGGIAIHSAERATQLATATLGISSETLAYRKQLSKPGAGAKAAME